MLKKIIGVDRNLTDSICKPNCGKHAVSASWSMMEKLHKCESAHVLSKLTRCKEPEAVSNGKRVHSFHYQCCFCVFGFMLTIK